MKWAYYNEWEPYCAQWLRNLIAAGHIPAGEVDERDIREVRGDDLAEFGQCHFFAGIGGWAYAGRLAEIPDDEPIWTGSCPCQPFSSAGQAKGLGDERHLWPAFHRLIAERHPARIFGEQVASKDGRYWLAGVRTDLEDLGYAVGAADLCAACVGAPHIRQRLWWFGGLEIAESNRGDGSLQPSERQEISWPLDASPDGGLGIPNGTGPQPRQQAATTMGHGSAVVSTSDPSELGNSEIRGQRADRKSEQGTYRRSCGSGLWSDSDFIPCGDGKARRVESGTFPLAHGVPARVGKLRAYGNAIVPQVAAEFMQAVMETAP